MDWNRIKNQEGASFSDYVITLVLLAGLAWAAWQFWSNPGNRQPIHPMRDMLNR